MCATLSQICKIGNLIKFSNKTTIMPYKISKTLFDYQYKHQFITAVRKIENLLIYKGLQVKYLKPVRMCHILYYKLHCQDICHVPIANNKNFNTIFQVFRIQQHVVAEIST